MSFVWFEGFVLGCDPMDATHRDFVDIVGRLLDADESELMARIAELLEHSEAHFAQENDWMAKTAFPPIHCHTDEHANVLAVIREVQRRLAGGDADVARNLARELPAWFANHAETMDMALANHMRRVGFDPSSAGSVKAA